MPDRSARVSYRDIRFQRSADTTAPRARLAWLAFAIATVLAYAGVWVAAGWSA